MVCTIEEQHDRLTGGSRTILYSFQVEGSIPQARRAISTAIYRDTTLYGDTALLGDAKRTSAADRHKKQQLTLVGAMYHDPKHDECDFEKNKEGRGAVRASPPCDRVLHFSVSQSLV